MSNAILWHPWNNMKDFEGLQLTEEDEQALEEIEHHFLEDITAEERI